MRKKLLFVVNVPWFFLSHRLPIAIAAKESGYEVHLATSAGRELEKIREKGIFVHEIHFTRSSSMPLAEIKILVSLYKLYKNLQPDIVHHVTIKPVLYGSFIAGITKVPHIINAISGLGFVFIAEGFIAKIRCLLVKAAYRHVFRKNNIIAIFQNPDDKEQFVNEGMLIESQTVLIRGSGVDVSKIRVVDEPSGIPTIVLVARMLWDKGIGEFVDAANLLKSRGVNAHFKLVGGIDKGNPKAIDKEQIDLWCKEGFVEWRGHSDSIEEVISGANIVCLPSYREGLPKVLIEAAACGRAVVTTDVPGCRYAIEPNVTGLLVPAYDVKSLAEAVASLISDDTLRRQMGMAGRLLAEEEFDIHKIIKLHLELYGESFI